MCVVRCNVLCLFDKDSVDALRCDAQLGTIGVKTGPNWKDQDIFSCRLSGRFLVLFRLLDALFSGSPIEINGSVERA